METNEQQELINNPKSAKQAEEEKSQESAEMVETKLGKVLRMIGIPCSKTNACKHKCGCIESILKDSFRITIFSYLIKLGLSALFKIKTLFTSPKLFLKLFGNKESISFGMFVGSFVFVFRSILCALRRYVSDQQQRYIPFIAGSIGGLLSSLFLDKKTRQSFALFLMARAIDISYHNLVKKGYLPEFKYFYVVMYSVCMSIAGYCYSNEPGCLPPEINKFYLDFSNESLGDMQMRQIWTSRKNNYLAQFGIPPQDPLQYMPKLRKYYEKLGLSKK